MGGTMGALTPPEDLHLVPSLGIERSKNTDLFNFNCKNLVQTSSVEPIVCSRGAQWGIRGGLVKSEIAHSWHSPYSITHLMFYKFILKIICLSVRRPQSLSNFEKNCDLLYRSEIYRMFIGFVWQLNVRCQKNAEFYWKDNYTRNPNMLLKCL